MLEISTASFDTDAKIYSNRRTVKLKMKTHKIKSIKKQKLETKQKAQEKRKRLETHPHFLAADLPEQG